MMTTKVEYTVRLPKPHVYQRAFIESSAPRKVIRAGRRSGKTVGMAIYAVQKFLAGRRVLYATPTLEQVDKFWKTCTHALSEPIERGVFYKNETLHLIEKTGTEQRIRAKTAYNADTLRGDYADELILDEWQLVDEEAWEHVGAPMLLDNNGNAIFIYTPPSLHSRSASKARDPRHAARLYARAQADNTGRWATFHFTSHDNPHISRTALSEISRDMTALAVRQEIMAEDIDEAPGALWTRAIIEQYRVWQMPLLERIVVAVDPAATALGDAAGIVTVGSYRDGLYVIGDDSLQGSPNEWATAAVTAYHKYKADSIVAESNQGGEMVALTIHTVDPMAPVKLVHASRGKQVRAEPVAAMYEQGRVHHVGQFPALESEMVLWQPGDASPDRMDALVWGGIELMIGATRGGGMDGAEQVEDYESPWR